MAVVNEKLLSFSQKNLADVVLLPNWGEGSVKNIFVLLIL